MKYNKSRLTRHIEGQEKRKIIIMLVVIMAILVTLLRFSSNILDILGSAVLFVNREKVTPEPSKTISILAPPRIGSDFNATSSARVRITGTATEALGRVELYINGKRVAERKLIGKSFEFSMVELEKGENLLKARQVINNQISDFSDDLVILYTNEEVKIENLSPSDGQEFKKGDQIIEISGNTNPNNKVTINDFRAIVDQDGKFSYNYKLADGENKITVIATSPTDKKKEQTITIKYSP